MKTATKTGSVAPPAPAAAKRVYNFSAGPATLPEEVIRRAQSDLWSLGGTGIGIMEHSHRGKAFMGVIEEAEADCRRIGQISDDYAVLFLQGGATLQFAMIPMNFLGQGQSADYLDTGVWASAAIKEAKKLGKVNVAFEGAKVNYSYTPEDREVRATPDAVYLHYCSNNTIYGTRFRRPPRSTAPLVSDMSSEIYSRRWDLAAHALVYAGAQKNLGPAGTTLVIIRRDFMERGRAGLPVMLDYREHAAKGSCLNTPPTFGIYVMGQVFKWIERQGGLAALEQRNEAKAKLLYDAIDGSGGFYRPVARADSRSAMNVCFRTPSEELDARFDKEAQTHDMDGLKGHRNVGGLRASIYNAFPREGCLALSQFMRDFASRNA
jgi:phosphoserine aminotransferase